MVATCVPFFFFPALQTQLHHHQRQTQKSTTTSSPQHNHNLHQKIWMNQKSKPTNSLQPNVFDWRRKEEEEEASGLTAFSHHRVKKKKEKDISGFDSLAKLNIWSWLSLIHQRSFRSLWSIRSHNPAWAQFDSSAKLDLWVGERRYLMGQNQNPAPMIMVLVFWGSRFDGGGGTRLN